MTTGILLIAEGTPSNESHESMLKYACELNACEYASEHLGLTQRIAYKKVIMPIVAKRWAKHLARNGGRAAIEYRSALNHIAQMLSQSIAKSLLGKHSVAVGMMQGEPSIESAIQELASQGCQGFLLLPLVAFDLHPLITPAIARSKRAIEQALGAKKPSKVGQAPWLCESKVYRNLVIAHLEEGWNPRPNSRLIMLMPSYPKSSIGSECVLEEQVVDFRAYLEKKTPLSPSQVHVAYLSDMENGDWTGPFAEKMLLGWVGGSVRDVRAIVPAFTLENAIVSCEAGSRLGNYFKSNSEGLPVEYAVDGRLSEPEIADALFDVAKRGLRKL